MCTVWFACSPVLQKALLVADLEPQRLIGAVGPSTGGVAKVPSRANVLGTLWSGLTIWQCGFHATTHDRRCPLGMGWLGVRAPGFRRRLVPARRFAAKLKGLQKTLDVGRTTTIRHAGTGKCKRWRGQLKAAIATPIHPHFRGLIFQD